MANDTIITVVGNLTADPEMRYTQNGVAVANFTIASTPRTFDRASNEWKDGEALFLRASVWREFAEHVASSLTKGSRVVATGRLRQRSFETKEGEKRTSIELEVDEIGPSLRYATAAVTRAPSSGPGGASGNGDWSQPVGGNDWASTPAPSASGPDTAAVSGGDAWGAGPSEPSTDDAPF
jgi:single-strand DNA-binding protein